MGEVMVDSTCCRAHQSSAGARKSSGAQAIGITHGGLSTKIHAVCDALGNPLRFVLTAGQRHDSKPVPEPLGGLQAKALLADKAYDSDKIVQAAQKQGMEVVIACRGNRKKPARPRHASLQDAPSGGKPLPAHEGFSPCGHPL